MFNEPGVVADCGRSPSCTLTATPDRIGFVEPLSNHDSSLHHPRLFSQNYDAHAWVSSTTARPTLSLAPIGFDHQMPMMPYFEESTMKPLGGPLTATPLRTQQQQRYMPLNPDDNMRSHNPGDIGYPELLPNGPAETSAGARDVSQHSRQPVTGPVRSKSGNPPSHDDSSGPQPPSFRCTWPGCTNKKPFARKGDLKRHARTIHHSPRSFRCKKCTKAFNRSDNLSVHIRQHR